MTFPIEIWTADGHAMTLDGPLNPDRVMDEEILPETPPDGCKDRASGELFGKYAEVRDPMGEIWKFA